MDKLKFVNFCAGKASSYLHVNDDKLYHCSAVYAAALHSLSLPYRMNLLGPTAVSNNISGALDVNGIVQILSGPRQNMVAILDSSVPAHCLTGISVVPRWLLQILSS